MVSGSALAVLFLSVAVGSTQCENERFDKRIVGGEPADIRDHPHQVQILYPNQAKCGGSIIRPKFILTAAHCTGGQKPDHLRVRAGTSMRSSGGVLRRVARIVQHPNYRYIYIDGLAFPEYDLSVIELSESLEFGDGIKPIRLIPQGNDVSPGSVAVTTGWGRLRDGGPTPKQLQKVSLPIIGDQTCKQWYGPRLTKVMLCAGYEQGGKSACHGDSGGPLVANGVLVGITSWGLTCAAARAPTVYTKVSQFTDWINSSVGE